MVYWCVSTRVRACVFFLKNNIWPYRGTYDVDHSILVFTGRPSSRDISSRLSGENEQSSSSAQGAEYPRSLSVNQSRLPFRRYGPPRTRPRCYERDRRYLFDSAVETDEGKEGRKCFYLTTHSTHFIYGYMASNIWLRTILIVRKETRCRHIGYSLRLTAMVLLYAPYHRQDNTYHGLCYASRGTLAGTRNSSMGSPHEGSIRRPIARWANVLTTELHLAPTDEGRQSWSH